MKALQLRAPALATVVAIALACGGNSPASDGDEDRGKEKPVSSSSDDGATAVGGGRGGQRTPTDPHEAAYAALVPRRGGGARIAEHLPYRGAEWRFFQLQDDSSGRPVFSARAAVDGKGHAVAPRLLADSAWNAFLTQEGLDPRTAQSRIAWLFLAGVVVKTGDGAGVDDPTARAMITDPSLEKTADGVKFVGWFARPPDIDPWRTTIEAPVAGPATVLEEMWHELPGAR
jgi:hypothetical protein